MLEQGISGEKEVEYHLNKANIGMYVMRDVNFSCDDLNAQVDFIVVTSHHCYFIECKNYNSDIVRVDENGNFEISTKYGRHYSQMGIKNPLSQVDDQLTVFKKNVLKDKNEIKEKFKEYFKTMVVFTNPQNRLNTKKAPDDIKNRILKSDNLIRQIELDEKNANIKKYTKDQMKQIADYILSKNVEIDIPEESSELYNHSEVSEKKQTKAGKKDGIILAIVGVLALIFISIAIKNNYDSIDNYLNDKQKGQRQKNTNTSFPYTMTDNQRQAIDIYKSAYSDSKERGFTIIHTSVCYEMSKIFNNGTVCPSCCNSLPMEINIIDESKITFYKPNTNSCSTLTININENSIENAVNEKKECHGEPVGMIEWDNNNEYYNKIGGYDKIRDLAVYAYKNGGLNTWDFDFYHISERGGNGYNQNTYYNNIKYFFCSVTGKCSTERDTTKTNFNKMVESYYYIMK